MRKNITELEGFSLDKKYFCKPICYEEAPFEILYTQECVKNCAVKYIIDKSCILNFQSPKSEKEEEIQSNEEKKDDNEEKVKAYDIMIENVETGFTSGDYDTSHLENGTNDVVEFEHMTITLTTTQNQKDDKKNGDVTTIDLGECEKILRETYQIPDDEMIYMKKIDVIQEGMKIPKVEYDVYSKLNGSNLVKLNLSFCENIKVDISIPLTLTEDIDKLNSSSRYYNDLCYTTTSDIGTDLTLNDRKNEFIEKNKTVCQEKCIFSYYDYNLQKAICSCNLEDSSPSDYLVINKTLLYDNILDVNNIANINILVCYKI